MSRNIKREVSKKALLWKNVRILKKKIILGYEKRGFFISFKLFKKKKKKVINDKPIEFLKTSRYVIPLPREDEKKKKKK